MLLSHFNVGLVVLVTFLHLGTPQFSAFVPVPVVKSVVDHSVNLTCRYSGVSVTTCLWERESYKGTGDKLILNVNGPNAQPGEGSLPGYTYYGSDLAQGECGVYIERVKAEDKGKWKCSLITDSAGVYRGAVQLDVFRKPEHPIFLQNVDHLLTGKLAKYGDIKFNGDGLDTHIACLLVNGRSLPTFQWFIDNEPIREGLAPVNTIVNNGSSYTYQMLHHSFTWRDNGKKLRCVVPNDDNFTPTNDAAEIALDIEIEFSPRAIQYVPVEMGKEKVVSVLVSANPKPHTIIWTIDDDEFLLEGESNAMYNAERLKEISPRLYQANLKIKLVSEKDLTRKFLLKVVSEFGVVSFEEEVRLTKT